MVNLQRVPVDPMASMGAKKRVKKSSRKLYLETVGKAIEHGEDLSRERDGGVGDDGVGAVCGTGKLLGGSFQDLDTWSPKV